MVVIAFMNMDTVRAFGFELGMKPMYGALEHGAILLIA